ncbi:hypothetical protein [Tateyamaria pelophila]|uniref:hypothetical protein n=1 Tax=Tateyamaria pelophila TaxID=328415 RepID=UPI001CBEDD25|nr:hypothetical protein [Tateyamaria pelophila]
MATRPTKIKPDQLEGSNLHHDLKNQPGEEGNPDHAEGSENEALDEELVETIQEADADTQIANQFRKKTGQSE